MSRHNGGGSAGREQEESAVGMDVSESDEEDGDPLDLPLLSLIYPLSDLPVPDVQSNEAVYSLGRLLHRVASTLKDDRDGVKEFCWATKALLHGGGQSDGIDVRFFGGYGCASITQASSFSAESYSTATHIHLVGLDEWRFRGHSSHTGGREFTSVSQGTAVLYVGVVEDVEAFWISFEGALQKAERERRGDKRHAGLNKQGLQKTPAFIFAVMTDILEGLVAEEREDGEAAPTLTKPPGGYTDVGMHTGSKARSTCWPLVEGVAWTLFSRYSDAPFSSKGQAEQIFEVVLV